jgi:hypothetical protein
MGRWLLRMSRWSRNPPSEKKIKFVLAIIVVALVIVGIEAMGWWPDWATAQKMRR